MTISISAGRLLSRLRTDRSRYRVADSQADRTQRQWLLTSPLGIISPFKCDRDGLACVSRRTGQGHGVLGRGSCANRRMTFMAVLEASARAGRPIRAGADVATSSQDGRVLYFPGPGWKPRLHLAYTTNPRRHAWTGNLVQLVCASRNDMTSAALGPTGQRSVRLITPMINRAKKSRSSNFRMVIRFD